MSATARQCKQWTSAEINALRAHYLTHSDGNSYPEIKTRTHVAVRTMAAKLGLYHASAKHAWRTSEIKILTEEYSKNGPFECAIKLPGRSLEAIITIAQRLKLQLPVMPKVPGEVIDEAVRRRAESGELNAAIFNDIAMEVKVHPHRVRKAVSKLGIDIALISKDVWSQEEKDIVAAHYPDMHAIAKALKDKGYKRSHESIYQKTVIMQLHKLHNDCFTANDIANGIGMSARNIRRLAANCFPPASRSYNGADAWSATQVKEFMINNFTRWDSKNIDKHFLVAVLKS